MDITVQERRFSFTSEFDISSPEHNYYARKAYFSFNDKIRLTSAGGHLLANIRGYFSPLRSKHDFQLADGRLYRFHCEKIWKGVYICEGNGEDYRIYRHKGLRSSIFKADRQIASIEKNRLVVGKGNRYAIRIDSDADVVLVLCMVLTLSTSQDGDKDSSVTVDLGNVGPEERPFDANWQPR